MADMWTLDLDLDLLSAGPFPTERKGELTDPPMRWVEEVRRGLARRRNPGVLAVAGSAVGLVFGTRVRDRLIRWFLSS